MAPEVCQTVSYFPIDSRKGGLAPPEKKADVHFCLLVARRTEAPPSPERNAHNYVKVSDCARASVRVFLGGCTWFLGLWLQLGWDLPPC